MNNCTTVFMCNSKKVTKLRWKPINRLTRLVDGLMASWTFQATYSTVYLRTIRTAVPESAAGRKHWEKQKICLSCQYPDGNRSQQRIEVCFCNVSALGGAGCALYSNWKSTQISNESEFDARIGKNALNGASSQLKCHSGCGHDYKSAGMAFENAFVRRLNPFICCLICWVQ